MDVRPATPDDADAASTVAEAAWWETYPGILDTDDVDAALTELYDEEFLRHVIEEREDVLFLVAEDAGDVVGFATAQQTWADEVEVHTLYVHPDRWGEGTGTALLAEIEESARAAGVDRLRVGVLSGNHVGRSFFESRGFERVETATAEVGDASVPENVFERPLDGGAD